MPALLTLVKGRHHGDEVLNAAADGIRAVLKTHKGIACRYDADIFYTRNNRINSL